jgi:predicted N-acyltransferase
MSEASFVAGIDAVAASEWNALAGSSEPFLRHEFLSALEASGSVGGDSGWQPHHLLLREPAGNRLLAALPCYLKSHSWGEYVFDWAWAEAYQRARKPYYPKLLSAVPFTPATGPRLLLAPGQSHAQLLPRVLEAVRAETARRRLSSWHLLFPEPALADACAGSGLLHRRGVQYHWFNRGYRDFADFLDAFQSRKRKQLRRERRTVAEQDLVIERLVGRAIDTATWDCFYRFYQLTYAKRSGHGGYLEREFFHRLGAAMPERLLLVIARRNGVPVAGALNVIGDDTLYGRYWGCSEEHAQLHFELCYYQGIEFCIERGLARFDAGAQGEHKLARGFEPVLTDSFHHIENTAFREAIADFLAREQRAMRRYQHEAAAALPFREDDQETPSRRSVSGSGSPA